MLDHYPQVKPASDVWSYGVTLWEIYSRAALPYDKMTNLNDHFLFLERGGRLSQPLGCPRDMLVDLRPLHFFSYTNVMQRCWIFDSDLRPGFGDLFVDMTNRHKEALTVDANDSPSDPAPSYSKAEDAGYVDVNVRAHNEYTPETPSPRKASEMDDYELPRSKET